MAVCLRGMFEVGGAAVCRGCRQVAAARTPNLKMASVTTGKCRVSSCHWCCERAVGGRSVPGADRVPGHLRGVRGRACRGRRVPGAGVCRAARGAALGGEEGVLAPPLSSLQPVLSPCVLTAETGRDV